MQSPLKTKDFIFLLFFFIFSKKGGSNFLKTAYLFSIHPSKCPSQKLFVMNTKTRKNFLKNYFTSAAPDLFFSAKFCLWYMTKSFGDRIFGWLVGK